MSTWRSILRDIKLYSDDGPWYRQSGFWATATYRFGSFANHLENRAARLALLGVHKALAAPWRVVKGVHIPPQAEIGPGLRLPHPQNILIPPESVIGEDCSIYQDVTVGRGPGTHLPRLGNNVMVFPGARVLGGVTIGDDARIGANAVVTRDVPAGATVTVSAARIIPARTAQRLRPDDNSNGSGG